ncbi:MAG: flagellar type III secretion system pore protein FliP [Bacillota bacterium]
MEGIAKFVEAQGLSTPLKALIILTLLAVLPAMAVLMTSFTRTVIVLSFLRNAMSTQQIPPNQVIIGLSLVLTVFVMAPVFGKINSEALQPYLAGKLDEAGAWKAAEGPMREFMFRQTREKDLALMIELAGMDQPQEPEDVPTYVLVPAFCFSELKTAFQMGFMLFVPFLVIDMVVASALMAMGMLMLPPMMISLPFKILLFVMADGWNLVVRSIVLSFK